MSGPEKTSAELTVEEVERQIHDAEKLHSHLTERLSRTGPRHAASKE
jgi:hypothetical protein